ncbi:2-acylglycerol O-acyltransferase 3, partial [Quaeritorhiza haematococci]
MAVALFSAHIMINTILLSMLLVYWRFTWPFFALYAVWAYVDAKTPFEGGTDRARFMRDWGFWKNFDEYFDAHLVKTVDLDPQKRYLFGYHPHGIYCYGAWSNFIRDDRFSRVFPGIKLRTSTLDLNFFIPIWRELQLAYGLIGVSAKSIRNALSLYVDVGGKRMKQERKGEDGENGRLGGGKDGNGEDDDKEDIVPRGNGARKGQGAQAQDGDHVKTPLSVLVVLGGAEEALLAFPGTNDLVLNKRKGFIKMAIQTG